MNYLEVHFYPDCLLIQGSADLRTQTEPEQTVLMEDKFLIPYQQNPRFIGRTELLRTLKDKLYSQVPMQYNHRIALYGMGGVGKTQTALEYVYVNKISYDRIYWITAVNQTSLFAGYQKIAETAGLKIAADLTPVKIAKAVLSWLRSLGNWLIVIDNLDDIEVISGFLPENGSDKHTLITTRNPNSEGIPAQGLEIPLFTPEESVALFAALSKVPVTPGSPEEKQADEIVKELGYLPLAIEQAAAYVREVTHNFITYREDYEQNRRDLHQWIPQGNREYPYSVATTWSMSFNIIRNNNPQAAKLFRILSFLNPDGILVEFLISGAEALESDLQQVVTNRIEMARSLLDLEKLSLIKWDRHAKSIIVHRLVQTVVRDELFEAELAAFLTTIINLCDRSFPIECTNETRQLCRIYQSQVSGPLMLTSSIQTPISASVIERFGEFLRIDGKYDESEKYLLQAVDIQIAISGINDPSTLTSMSNLALTYSDQGRTAEAAELQEQVLEKRKRILGADHPSTLTSMSNLALTYSDQGRTAEAAELQEQVLEKRKRILGADHPSTLTSMSNLALTYSHQGRTAEAAELQEQVLEKRKRILGADHPSTLTSMSNLALTYSHQGRTAEAAELQEQVLEKRKRILGADHPSTLTSMSNLALTYSDQGRTAEAAELQEQVLEKTEEDPGGGPPLHADEHEQPRFDVLGSRADGRGGRVAGASVGEAEEDPGGGPPLHADEHEQPRFDVLGSRADGRGGRVAGASVGEAEEDPGGGPPLHADEHEQPRFDVLASRADGRGGRVAGASVGEDGRGSWGRTTPPR